MTDRKQCTDCGRDNDHDAVYCTRCGAELRDEPQTPCDRCGTFAELNDVAGRGLCDPCFDRLDPIERTPLDLGHVIKGVLRLLKRIGLPAAAVLVVINLPLVATGFWLASPPALPLAYQNLVTVFAEGVVLVMAHGAITGESATGVMAAMARVVPRWPALVVAQLLVALVTMVGGLMCLVPGVIASMALSVVAPIVLLEDSSGRFGTAALRASWRHMDGHKGTAFAAHLLCGAPAFFLGAAFMVTGATATMAIGGASPTQPAGDVLSTLPLALLPVATTPIVFVPAVIYVKLRAVADAGALTRSEAEVVPDAPV